MSAPKYKQENWSAMESNSEDGWAVYASDPKTDRMLREVVDGVECEKEAELIAAAPDMEEEIERLTGVVERLAKMLKSIHTDVKSCYPARRTAARGLAMIGEEVDA